MQKRRLTSPALTGLILSIFALTVGSIVGAIALTAMYTGHAATPLPDAPPPAPAPVSGEDTTMSTPGPSPVQSVTPSTPQAGGEAAEPTAGPAPIPTEPSAPGSGDPTATPSPSPSGLPTPSPRPTPRPSRTCRGDQGAKGGSAMLQNCNN